MAEAQPEQINGIKGGFVRFLQTVCIENSFVVAGRPICIWNLWLAARTFETTVSQQIDHPSKFHHIGAQLDLPTDPQTGQIPPQSLDELQKRYIRVVTVMQKVKDFYDRQSPLHQTNVNGSPPERNISTLQATIDIYSHIDFSGMPRDTVATLPNHQFETRLRSYISDWDRVVNNKRDAGDTPHKQIQTPVPGLVIMKNPPIPTTVGVEQAHEPTRDSMVESIQQESACERNLNANLVASETEPESRLSPVSANTPTPLIQSAPTPVSAPQTTVSLASAPTGTDDDGTSRTTIASLKNHPQLQALLSASQEIQREETAKLKNRMDECERVILHLWAKNRHPEAAKCMARLHEWRLLMFVLLREERKRQEAMSFARTVIALHRQKNRFRWRGSLFITDEDGHTYPELLVLLETMNSSPQQQDDDLVAWPRTISVTPIKRLGTPDEFTSWLERSKPEGIFALAPEVAYWPVSQRTPENVGAIQDSVRGFSLAQHAVFMNAAVLHGTINLATGGTNNIILFPGITPTILGSVVRILVARFTSPPNLVNLPGVPVPTPANMPKDPAPPAAPQSTLPTAGANSNPESRFNNKGVESSRMNPVLPRRILPFSSYWTAGDRQRIVALIEVHGDDYEAIAAKLSRKSPNQVRNYIKRKGDVSEILNRVLLEKATHHT